MNNHMSELLNKFKKHNELESKIANLKKEIENKKLEHQLKTFIDNRDIDSALELYKNIQLPAINSFILDEINLSIKFKNFDRIYKIMNTSKESLIYERLKEIARNFFIEEYSLHEVSIDQVINIIQKHKKHIDLLELLNDVMEKAKTKFIKCECYDILEIDRWLETYVRMMNEGILKHRDHEEVYTENELVYVRMVKDKRLIKDLDEKNYFVQRVEKRWARFGKEMYKNEMCQLFEDLIYVNNFTV